MDGIRKINTWSELPFYLDEKEWGKLRSSWEEAPGVFYVSTELSEDIGMGRELYVVTRAGTPCVISPEVAERGTEVGDVRVFEYQGADSLYNLVRYELTRYQTVHGLPRVSSNESLYCMAAYYGEYFPWYFGGVIPPRDTPRGLTVRTKKVGEGLFFLETEQCQWLLAVSYPIWDSELSQFVQELGETWDDGLATRAVETQYLFFTCDCCVPAIYELTAYGERAELLAYVGGREALEKQLREQFPQYAQELPRR